MDDFTTWKVLPERSGWIVKEYPTNGFESRHTDIGVAIDAAKRLAMDNAPGQVVVHAEDGSVKHAVLFSSPRTNGDREEPSRLRKPGPEPTAP